MEKFCPPRRRANTADVGLKTTGVTNRRFLPNIQTVKVVQNDTVQRIKVCEKCLKAGKVVKA